jgi:hypothetical protein
MEQTTFVRILVWILVAVGVKSLMIGSSFSFFNLVRYGRKYMNWYVRHREEEYDPHS